MSRLQQILESGAEPAPRHVRRRVGVAVAIAIAALMGWAVFKNVAGGGLAEAEIAAGMDDLAVAIQGDNAAFLAAEQHFVDAASVSVLDRYPAFLISTTRKLASPTDGQNDHDEIAALLAAGDFEAAHQRVGRLENSSPQAAEYWRKLLADLALRLDE